MKDKIIIVFTDFLKSCVSLIIISPLVMIAVMLLTFIAKVSWWLITLTWSIW
jgi:hypothetical protein